MSTLTDERSWWTISVKTPDGNVSSGSGYSPIEAGQDLQRSVAGTQAEAARVQQHADNTAKALDVLAAILLPEPGPAPSVSAADVPPPPAVTP